MRFVPRAAWGRALPGAGAGQFGVFLLAGFLAGDFDDDFDGDFELDFELDDFLAAGFLALDEDFAGLLFALDPLVLLLDGFLGFRAFRVGLFQSTARSARNCSTPSRR